IKLGRPNLEYFNFWFFHEVGIAVEQIGRDRFRATTVTDCGGIIACSSKKQLKCSQPLLAIHDLEARDTARRESSARFQYDCSHEMRKTTFTPGQTFNGLGANIAPERLPLFFLRPYIMSLIDRNAKAIAILKKAPNNNRTCTHNYPSDPFQNESAN